MPTPAVNFLPIILQTLFLLDFTAGVVGDGKGGGGGGWGGDVGVGGGGGGGGVRDEGCSVLWESTQKASVAVMDC